MQFDQLWAPWRIGYIRGDRPPEAEAAGELRWLPGADPACFLCRAAADSQDRENLVVHRGQHTLSVLNRFPYNNGHLLVAPRRHQARLDQLTAEEHLECAELLARFVALFERLMNAEGFNVGLNLGRVAGAGVPGHLHWHLVPRWNGDTNFMPTLAGANVIPQALDEAWQLITGALKSP